MTGMSSNARTDDPHLKVRCSFTKLRIHSSMRSVLIRPEVKQAIEDAMNSANYSPWDAFSIASAYAESAVETVRFA